MREGSRREVMRPAMRGRVTRERSGIGVGKGGVEMRRQRPDDRVAQVRPHRGLGKVLHEGHWQAKECRMKNGLRFAVAWGVMAVATLPAAEESFSKAIPTGDFSAAGLAKLSAEELARLDALVRDFKSGALETAR